MLLPIEQILVFDTQVLEADLVRLGRRLYASQPDLQNILAIDTGTRRTVRTLAVETKPSVLFAVKEL